MFQVRSELISRDEGFLVLDPKEDFVTGAEILDENESLLKAESFLSETAQKEFPETVELFETLSNRFRRVVLLLNHFLSSIVQ
jgi:hypothetical protein